LVGGQWLEAEGLFWLKVNSWRQEDYFGWGPMAGGWRNIMGGGQ